LQYKLEAHLVVIVTKNSIISENKYFTEENYDLKGSVEPIMKISEAVLKIC
jgi:hypothetical protein